MLCLIWSSFSVVMVVICMASECVLILLKCIEILGS